MTAMDGRIVTATFADGAERRSDCGWEECECPNHEGAPIPAGTYITIRLDEDLPIDLWRVSVMREEGARE